LQAAGKPQPARLKPQPAKIKPQPADMNYFSNHFNNHSAASPRAVCPLIEDTIMDDTSARPDGALVPDIYEGGDADIADLETSTADASCLNMGRATKPAARVLGFAGRMPARVQKPPESFYEAAYGDDQWDEAGDDAIPF